MTIQVVEFTYGYFSETDVDIQMTNFIKRNNIQRNQIIDIRYSITSDPEAGKIFSSALLTYERND